MGCQSSILGVTWNIITLAGITKYGLKTGCYRPAVLI
jgi:hypothetical protein